MFKKLLIAVTISVCAATSAMARDLDAIRKSGYLSCGVVNSFKGFSHKEETGEWTGFMPDWCRVIAIGIFNDAKKVKYTEISGDMIKKAIKNDIVDVMVASLPISFPTSVKGNIRFTAPIYFDRISILANPKLFLRKISDLKDQKETLCTYKEFTSLRRLTDYLNTTTSKNITLNVKGNLPDAIKAYESGKCKMFAGNGVYVSLLADETGGDILIDNAGDLQYGIAVNEKYERLFKMANWSFFATVIADRNGITSENIDSYADKAENDAAILYNNHNGKEIGSDEKWFYNIIKKMGNYRQIYDKNLKNKLPLKINGHSWRNPNAEGVIYYPTID